MLASGASRALNGLTRPSPPTLIVSPDLDLCRAWGQLRAERQVIGQTIDPQDAWIAATALHYALPLVTHNASHFEGIPGLDVRTVATP